jgi:hypothetical protein
MSEIEIPVVRAKFRVESKTELVSGKTLDGTILKQTEVKLSPVTAGSEENKTFWRWTPSGSITLGVLNQAAADQFVLGREYYIDFVTAP